MKFCQPGLLGVLGALVCVALPDVGTVVARAQEVSTADGPGQSGLANKSSEAMPAGAKRPAVTLPQPSLRRGLRIWRNVELVRDSVAVKFDVYRPDDQRGLPLVLMIHGGAWSIGDKRSMEMHAKQLANEGFVVVSTNYRLAPKHQYPAQLDDCDFVLQWLLSNPEHFDAATEHYALWGYSAGAQLAVVLASRQTKAGRSPVCCIAGGIPGDFLWVPEDSDMLAHVFGGTRAQKPDVYRDASPVECVTPDLCPHFIYHGTVDFVVPYKVGRRMYEKLKSAGVAAELLEVAGKEHFFAFVDSTARKQAIAFIKKNFSAAKKGR
ncbi:MAG: hypothetical protein Aurels2KO_05060 [Aureliella sp.]